MLNIATYESLAVQIMAANRQIYRDKESREANLTDAQREAAEKRKRICLAVNRSRKTTEDIAKEVGLPIGYVQKVLATHYETWGIKRTQKHSSSYCQYWRETDVVYAR